MRSQLDPASASALTTRAYAAKDLYTQPWHRELGLFDFEERALRDHFPDPPASILVPACGGGRELIALAARGYTVVGSDPDPQMVAAARAHLGASATVDVGWLEDLAGDPSLMAGPWDAVVVGWGALGHLLEAERRLAVLAALRQRTEGPVLVSWRIAPRRGLRGYAHSTAAVRSADTAGVAAGGSGEPATGRAAWQDRLFVGLDGLVDVRLDRQQLTDEAEAAGFGRVDYLEPGEVGYPSAVLLP